MAEVISRAVYELATDNTALDRGLDNAAIRFSGLKDKVRDASKGAGDFGYSFQKSLLGAQVPLDNSEKTLSKIWSGLKTGAGLIGVTFGATAILGFTKSVFDSASAIHDQAQAVGFSAEAFQRQKYAVEQSGGSVETFTKATNKLNDNLANGDKSTVAALTAAGLQFDKIRQMKPEEAWLTVTEAVGKIEDPMRRAQVAQDLFGKGALELLPGMIEGYRKLGEGASVMSDETINRLEAAQDAWEALGNKVTIVTGEIIGSALKGAETSLSGFSKLWGDIKATVTGGIEGHREYMASLQKTAEQEANLKVEQEKRIEATGKVTVKTKEQTAADEKAAQAAKAHADKIRELSETFSGANLAERVDDVYAAYKKLTPAQKESEDVQKRVTDEVMKLAKEGAKLPPELAKIWRETATADFNMKMWTSTLKGVNVEMHKFSEIAANKPHGVLDANLIKTGDAALQQVSKTMTILSGETLKAQNHARLTADAYETLGLKTKKQLDDEVTHARDAYAQIIASGERRRDVLEAAAQRVAETEEAAGLRTKNVWTETVWPGVRQVATDIENRLGEGVVTLIGHWNRWRDVARDIWSGLKSDLFKIFADILNQFEHSLVDGLIGTLLGKKDAFSSAFSLVFGGGAKAGMTAATEVVQQSIPGLEAAGVAGGAAWGAGFTAAGIAAIYAFGPIAAFAWGEAFIKPILEKTAGAAATIIGNLFFGGGDHGTGPQTPDVDPNTGIIIKDPNQPNNPFPGQGDPGNPDANRPDYGTPETGGPYDTGAPGFGIQPFAKGTPGLDYMRFRPGGQRIVAEGGPEAIIPKNRTNEFAADVAAALGGRSVVIENHWHLEGAVTPDLQSLEKFAERFIPVQRQVEATMGLVGGVR